MWIALAIFLVTYVLIAAQRVPRLYIGRPTGALLGAVAMVAFGVLSRAEAYQAIDWDTIIFLMGMMILVGYLGLAGLFEGVEAYLLRWANTPRRLLMALVFTSGILSAFLLNDTICLMLTPFVLKVSERRGLPPLPYLIALGTSANIGSAATIIGNPQNAWIALHAGLSFAPFALHMAPIALGGLLFNAFWLNWVFRDQLTDTPFPPEEQERPAVQRGLLRLSLGGFFIFFSLLLFQLPPAGAAMSVAAVVILLASTRPRHALRQVDWSLLLFFAGLFVVMRGLEVSGWVDALVKPFNASLLGAGVGWMWLLTGLSVVLSNLVSNVPAVLLLAPLVEHLPDPQLAWLLLAGSATLAGNLTPIASVANIIVFEGSQRKYPVGFWQYLRVGVPLTLVTLAWMGLWLALFP